jgi:hypothetical protein
MPARPKIDEREFLELLDKGTLPVDIARTLKVSPAAITKKLKKYRPSPIVQKYMRERRHDEEPEADGKQYTEKKALYVETRLTGKTPSQAAMVAYDCKTPMSAAVMGNRMEKDPQVKRAIADCLLDAGVTNPYRALKIKTILDDGSFDHQLKGLDHVAKLAGDYAPVKIDMTIDPGAATMELAELRAKTEILIASLRSLAGQPLGRKEIDVTPQGNHI